MTRIEEIAAAILAWGQKHIASAERASGQDGGDILRVTTQDGKVLSLSGDRLSQLQSLPAKEAAEQVVETLIRLQAHAAEPGGPILPIFRSAEFVEAAQSQLSSDPVDEGVIRSFAPGLWLGYAADYPDRIEGIYNQASVPDRWDTPMLEARSLEALGARWAAADTSLVALPVTKLRRFLLDGSFDASLILLRDVWDCAAKAFDLPLSQVRAAIPAGDVCVFAGVSDQEYEMDIELFSDVHVLASMVRNGGNAVLCPLSFRWDDNSGQPVAEEESGLGA